MTVSLACRIGSRRSVSFGGQYREAMFYSSDFSRRLPVGIFPVSYYSHGSVELGEYVMLFEDCVTEACTPMNFVFGNQVWGVPKPVIPARNEIDVLHAMYRRAAQLHRMFWRDESLLALVRALPSLAADRFPSFIIP
jgi:hypothetical protein